MGKRSNFLGSGNRFGYAVKDTQKMNPVTEERPRQNWFGTGGWVVAGAAILTCLAGKRYSLQSWETLLALVSLVILIVGAHWIVKKRKL